MAIVVNSDASVFKRTANVPTLTSMSMWGWFMYTTDRNTFTGVLGIYAGADGAPTASDNYLQVFTDVDGTTMRLGGASGTGTAVTSGTLQAVSTNTWYFFAMTCAGMGAGQTIAYVRSISQNAFTSVNIDMPGSAFTAARMEWGRDCFTGDFITGRIHGCGAADSVYSSDDLLRLSYFHEPQGLPSLNVLYPTIVAASNDAKVDRSGNARDATATAGALADPPPLAYRSRFMLGFPTAAAAGGLFVNPFSGRGGGAAQPFMR